MILSYTIVFLSLLLAGLIYYRLARQFGIVDKPNSRSSHSATTIRGGGILFPLAVVFWWMSYDFQNTWMVLGIVWISVVSFLDDIYTISRKLRLGIQFLGLSMAFYDLGVFDQESWWALPVLYFVALGVINAINFMDGINGITGLYGLVFLGSLLAVNIYMPIFSESLIRYVILALCVFLVFNFRKDAKMFAGDIGSISLAYLIIYFLVQWYLSAHTWTIVLFLLIYGADSLITFAHRLFRRENVALPHRTHLYQILANQVGIDHVTIALIYSILQFGLNFFLFIYPQAIPEDLFGFGILVLTAVVYSSIKIPLIKKYEVYQN
ncbi:glycosyltransferase family 4 protein [Algoriphagus aestuariicola]|jgi:UDP-N-acetylmuramyl pentapeptide phosphotransferase/UDP-N-acetylglucosamine-1-phosphate transferase|uniref:Glycosyltransferase family 4 protein n=1 Tax=Algoriphagus aestuariicola TaxID=1852016 RepID=A0ABS3BKU8_9BACT|nr:glycosyltransferase family 4 protein [Algoriphagus aestuariicola]MBN7799929.1 glycosyltransferase family 4 protein [Algoriphagus aestuariicola]